ncbi:MAG: NHLP bacteriocin system secretion protein [Microscillaceae bacterium]|nr:NHLP bacteriocin system secretion protein [Microscillaceae bacterium]
MSEAPLFRKKALERLSSPENLHEFVSITSARSWLAILALSILLLGLGFWAFLGTLPKIVEGQGILIQSGGIAEVSLPGTGIVNEILVEEGQLVRPNDTLAIIAQPELQLQINNAREQVSYLLLKRTQWVRYQLEDQALQALLLEKFALHQKLTQIHRQIRAQEQSLYQLQAQKNKQVARQNSARLALIRLQRAQLLYQNEQKKIETQINLLGGATLRELEDYEAQLREVEQTLNELEVRLSLTAYLKSAYPGKVIEIMTKKGQLIEAGLSVMSLEIQNQTASRLEAVIYFSPEEGKKIEKGMTVRLAPSTVKTEEFGYLQGVVEKVSEYPATRRGMMRVLGNAELVETFANGEPPIAVQVKLKAKPQNPSGYAWTSAQGPKKPLKAGTLCQARIEVARQKPIQFLLPRF